jgi:hypothetical protein
MDICQIPFSVSFQKNEARLVMVGCDADGGGVGG